jgi:hypothetical protein
MCPAASANAVGASNDAELMEILTELVQKTDCQEKKIGRCDREAISYIVKAQEPF